MTCLTRDLYKICSFYVCTHKQYLLLFLWLERSHIGVDGRSFPYPAIGITCSGNIVELQPDLQLSPCAITTSLLNFTAAAMFCITNIRDIRSVFLDVAVLKKVRSKFDRVR
jgi:hypothetical protein